MFDAFLKRFRPGGVGYIIAGLGNPGPKYDGTRHNVGYMCVDALAGKAGVTTDRLKFKSLTAEITLNGQKALLLKPVTFMNLSGEAVAAASRYYKIPPERTIVVCDDISLPPGRIRVRRKGSDGGHNGLKSIIMQLDSEDFPRVKIGIGQKPHPDYDLAKWVLSVFSGSEKKPLAEAVANSTEAARMIVSGNIDEAMNRFNGN